MKKVAGSEKYDQHREKQAAIQRAKSEAGREIGPLPKVVDPSRREQTSASLHEFLSVYFPDTFTLDWSPDHDELIARLQVCIESGGLFALALPRGSGKTSVSVRAALWAVLTGRRRFPMIVGATERLAEKLLGVIRSELQHNEVLAADYPEACYPIRKLENITKRQAGQTLDGKPTMIKLTLDEIVFPTVSGSPCSGSIIRVAGLTGSIRGQIGTTAQGKTIRPDFVILDDPQTRETAKSPTQTRERIDLVNGDVLGLAGPGQSIACVMACTVIYPNDLSDYFLDREKNPTWSGQRGKLLVSLPKNLDIWDQYAELRRESFQVYGDNRMAMEFYRERQEDMDAGAVAGWPARVDPGDLSAIQTAMHIKIDKPRAFNSEYQNEPEGQSHGNDVVEVLASDVLKKLTNINRGLVPRNATRLTCGIDVGLSVIWWVVCGWDERFGGSIIDYGVYPKQNRSYFAATDARPTLRDAYQGVSEEARIYAGIQDTLADVLGREWNRDGTSEVMKITRCLVDSGYKTETVFQACRQSPHSAIILPSKGYSVTAARKPMAEWAKSPNVRIGRDWRVGISGSSKARSVLFDTNSWKTFLAERLKTPPGATSSLGLFGTQQSVHEMFADHLASEYAVATTGHGRTVYQWDVRPDRTDNHWWDCLVYATVAASVDGLQWSADPSGASQSPPRKQMKFSDMVNQYRQKKAGA